MQHIREGKFEAINVLQYAMFAWDKLFRLQMTEIYHYFLYLTRDTNNKDDKLPSDTNGNIKSSLGDAQRRRFTLVLRAPSSSADVNGIYGHSESAKCDWRLVYLAPLQRPSLPSASS